VRRLAVLLGVVAVVLGLAYASYLYVTRVRQIAGDPGQWVRYETGASQASRHFRVMLTTYVATVLVLAGFACLRIATARWRRIRVFVSYQHGNLALVEEIRAAVRSRLLALAFVPFGPAEHDTVIDDVRRNLQSADAVLALPGTAGSFVDAELLAASTVMLPVIFVQLSETQTTPDTALRGYPVLDLTRLREHSFRPLTRLLLFVGRSWRAALSDALRTYGFSLSSSVAVILLLCSIVFMIRGVSEILFVISPVHAVHFLVVCGWVVTCISIAVLIFCYAGSLRESHTARRAARQAILTGNDTYELFERAMGHFGPDREILHCLVRGALPLRHP